MQLFTQAFADNGISVTRPRSERIENLLKLAAYLRNPPVHVTAGEKKLEYIFNMRKYFAIKYEGGAHPFGLEPRKWNVDLAANQLPAELADNEEQHPCGTVCCALGSGPFAGILPHEDDDWDSYHENKFHAEHTDSSSEFRWLFDSDWEQHDPTPLGAAQRIEMYLRCQADRHTLYIWKQWSREFAYPRVGAEGETEQWYNFVDPSKLLKQKVLNKRGITVDRLPNLMMLGHFLAHRPNPDPQYTPYIYAVLPMELLPENSYYKSAEFLDLLHLDRTVELLDANYFIPNHGEFLDACKFCAGGMSLLAGFRPLKGHRDFHDMLTHFFVNDKVAPRAWGYAFGVINKTSHEAAATIRTLLTDPDFDPSY